MAAPTFADLERSLRHALKDRVRVIEVRASWQQGGGIEWEGEGRRVGVLWVEPYQLGVIPTVVHELTHYVMRFQAERWGELEEPQIEGLANAVWQRIERVPARYWWWRKAIAAKLKGEL